MNMKKYIIASVAAVLVAATSAAQSLPFTAVDYDPAGLAKGGASLLQTSSFAFASTANPAAVPFAEASADFAAVYSMWSPKGVKSNVMGVAGAYNIKEKFGVSAGFTYGMNPSYDIYDQAGAAKGSFRPSDIQVKAGFAYRFIPSLSVGVNAGYASSSLAEGVSYGAFTSDVFLMGSFSGFKVAAGVADLGTGVVAASGAKFQLPTRGVVALGYGADFAEKHQVNFEVDAEYAFYGAFSAAFGAEYGFNDMIFARAGYRYGGNSVLPSFASVGAGVKVAGIKMNVAYLLANDLIGNTLSISLGYSF